MRRRSIGVVEVVGGQWLFWEVQWPPGSGDVGWCGGIGLGAVVLGAVAVVGGVVVAV